MNTALSLPTRTSARAQAIGRARPPVDNALLLERVAALEARLAALESQTTRQAHKDAEEIPWLVIAAAVAAVLRRPFVLTSVKTLPVRELSPWSLEGRLRHFASRTLR